jgi:pyridoxal phosphate enzyme (YggS family)
LTSRRSCAGIADRPGLLTPDQSLADAHQRVLERIDAACRRAGREPSSVQLVAISKTVSVERLHEALSIGLTALGENRVQEAGEKINALPRAEWHLVGHLQANKAERALSLFRVIESVDSAELARRLDRLAGESQPALQRFAVLLQVNVDGDPNKEGFDPEALGNVIDELAGLRSLELRGLMTVGRQVERAEDARPTFGRLAEVSERLRARTPGLGAELSMGMSDDFEVAIEEGATVVRVGRALFGRRPNA